MRRPMSMSRQFERASEALRQEAETFDQLRDHADRWFVLRLKMGYVTLILLPGIFLVCTYILFNARNFGPNVVTAAAGTMFCDGFAFLMAVWKIVLNPAVASKLTPVTTVTKRSIRTVKSRISAASRKRSEST
jgi:hypothetical protein